jgi:DHA1 family bicyclomycin/chloramphenicol resistance-like MFS transporter
MYIGRSMLLTLGLLAGLTPFAIDLYLPAIPSLARGLGAGIALAQISVTVYLGTFAAAQLVLGPVSDVLGRRSAIGAGLALFLVGTLACALAPTMGFLLGARAVQALGGAAVAVTVPALVRDICERDEYARTMSLVMLVMALAPLVAPTVGSLVLTHGTWRTVFALLFAIGLAAAMLFRLLIPETLPPERRGPAEPGRILRGYLSILGNAQGVGYLLTGALSFAGMMTFIVMTPYVYIELYGISPAIFGLLFALNVALAMVGTATNARLTRKRGAGTLLRLGLWVQSAAALIMIGLLGLGDPKLWSVAGAAAAYMSMTGLVLGNSMAGFMTLFPRMAGTASAMAGATRFGLGAAVGSAASQMHDGTARPLLVGMALCGLGAFAAHRLLCNARA